VLLAGRAAPAEPYLEPQPLGLDQLRVKGKPRPVDQVSLDKLKAELATDLPTGYEEMMRTVGPGLLRNTVRVYGPLSILRDTKSWRERIAQYWFWGDGPLLSKQASQSSVRIADTPGGDELVYVPTAPETLLVLPHEDEEVQLASKTGLLAALTRLLRSDSGRLPSKLPYEPEGDEAARKA